MRTGRGQGPGDAPPFVLDPRGAAFFPDEGVLAVADLHVGYEAAARQAGAGVPRHELDVLVPLLDALMDTHRPDVVVLNGDVKHAFTRRVLEEAEAVRAVWRRLADRARVVVVEGNHDALLGKMLKDADVVRAHRAGNVVFAHGHTAEGVERRAGDLLVVGHEHPALALRDEVGVTVRAPAFLTRIESGGELVLPAISPWAAGYDVLRRGGFMSPLLADRDRGEFRALVANGDEVLDFGEVKRLRRVMARR